LEFVLIEEKAAIPRAEMNEMKLGLIAGNGRFPFLLLDAARAEGLEVVVAAIEEETDPEIDRRAEIDSGVAVHWLSLGELSRLIDTFRKEGVAKAVMAGQVKHKQIFSSIRPDWRLAKLLLNLRTRSTDALLGAVAAGDIGSFFPPGDPRWKDADSAIFLSLALEELQHAGYRIVNIDTTLILAAPKIGPVAGEMRARVADLLSIDIDQVSIKAKTPEGLNLDHVAQCHAVALVERVQEPDDLKSMSAVIESQRQLEDVVEDLLSSVHGVPKKRINPVYDTEDIT